MEPQAGPTKEARTSVHCAALSHQASGCVAFGGSGPGSASPTTSSEGASSDRRPVKK